MDGWKEGGVMQTKTLLECCAVSQSMHCQVKTSLVARSLDDRRASLGFAVLDKGRYLNDARTEGEGGGLVKT